MGLNASGLALGGLLLVPVAIFVTEAAGWRFAWLALGLIVLLVAVPLGYLFIHDDPEKLGLRPDGDAGSPESVSDSSSSARSGPLTTDRWSDSFRSWPIRLISLAFTVDGFTTSVLLIHFVPYADDLGASPSKAALLFAVMMAFSVVGSTGTGLLSDKMDRRAVLTSIYSLRCFGFAALLLLPGNFGLWVAVAAIGLSWNAAASLTASLIADIYGLRAVGTITGVAYAFRQLGGASGVLLTGYLFDVSGTSDYRGTLRLL